MNVHFTKKSGNIKTGKIPVTSSPRSSCPLSCPLKGAGGCYGEDFRLKAFWTKVDEGTASNLLSWDELCSKIENLPEGQLWRHNQVGDLPTREDDPEGVDFTALHKLAKANSGKRGWTYTHKNPAYENNSTAIRVSNRLGFTINLSANSLSQADAYSSLNIGPVVVTVPANTPKVSFTPEGRKVVICPAQQIDELACDKCALCQKKDRSFIIGFRAHGMKKKALSLRLEVAQ